MGSFIFSAAALALDTGLQFGAASGLGTQDLRVTIMNIVRYALGFLGVVAIVIILYGGYVWMTAAGNAEKIETAKRILINAVIGLVIIFSAFMITSFIINQLIRATGAGAPGESCTTENAGEERGCYDCVPPNWVFDLTNFGCDPTIIRECRVVTISPTGTNRPMNSVVRIRFNHPNPTNINDIVVTDSSGAVAGTRTVSNNLVEFIPNANCPAPWADRKCFDANTTYRIETKTGAIACGGYDLVCGGLGGNTCLANFTTGDFVDTAAPEVTIIGTQICRDTKNELKALVNDDYGISYVNFSDPIQLNRNDNLITVPPEEFAQVEWDTTLSGYDSIAETTVTATAVDYDANQTSVSTAFALREAHCCNAVQDSDETGIDCGGNGCEPCVPVIEWVSPLSGATSTMITITGRRFGAIAGNVKFLADPTDPTDDELALAPTAAACSDYWSDEEIVVQAPLSAKKVSLDGPIQVTTNANQTDRTDEPPGSQIKDFDVNNTVRPGLCNLSPELGPINTAVDLFGINFVSGQTTVLFGGLKAGGSPIVSDIFGGKKITGARVPALRDGPVSVRVTTSQEFSNPLIFTVGPLATPGPVISDFNPKNGAPGTYVTIDGSNFGESRQAVIGHIYFVSATNQKTEASYLFPPECSNTAWSDNQIIVKVPSGLTINSNYNLKIEINQGSDTADSTFTVNNTIRPNICSVVPDNGPVGQPITIFGEIFNPPPDNARVNEVNFWDNKSQTNLKLGIFNRPAPAIDTETIETSVVAGAATGDLKAKNVAGNFSNPYDFRVGACSDNTSCGPNRECCAAGIYEDSCMPLGGCVGAADASTYTWFFSTQTFGPSVVETCNRSSSCQPGAISSPTPFSPVVNYQFSGSRQNDGAVPIDAVISARFTTKMHRPSLTVGGDSPTIKIFKCNLVINQDNSESPFDPADCTTPINGVLSLDEFNYLDSETPNADYFEFKPQNLLTKNYWYLVELDADRIYGESGIQLAGNEITGTTSKYKWAFKTRNSDELSQVGCVYVDPHRQTSTARGDEKNWDSSLSPQDFVCVVMRDNPPNWDWRTAQADNSDDPRAEIKYELGNTATSSATEETIDDLDKDVDVVADYTAENFTKSGKGFLTINFSNPFIIDRWPDCGEACLNSAIGARFDRPMESTTVNDSSNIKIYTCFNNADCRPGIGSCSVSGKICADNTDCPTNETCEIPQTLADLDDGGTKLVPGLHISPPFYEVREFSYCSKKLNQECSDTNPCGANEGACVTETSYEFNFYPLVNYFDGLLAPNTYYRVVINKDVKSAGELKLLGGLNYDDPADGLAGNDSYSWKFKTQAQFGLCELARVNVNPTQKHLNKQEEWRYAAKPYADQDICEPEFGQRLNPFSYNWQWRPINTLVGPDNSCDSDIADFWANDLPTNPGAPGYPGASLTDQPYCGQGWYPVYSRYLRNGCGNGIIELGEDCDTGRLGENDGCSDVCLLETDSDLGNINYNQAVCGNGIIELGEDCDTGDEPDNNNTDGCTNNCLATGSVIGRSLCGDNVIGIGEECDDADYLYCSSITTPANCTLGVDAGCFSCRELGADSNIWTACSGVDCDTCQANVNVCRPQNGDGCSATCTLESDTDTGNTNYNQSVCGNGKVEAGEECDVGNEPNNNDADGCSDSCLNTGSQPDRRTDPYQIAITQNQDGATYLQAWDVNQQNKWGWAYLTVGDFFSGGGTFGIINKWPDCSWACLNAEIGAQFNQYLTKTTIDEESDNTVYLYECGTDANCSVSTADQVKGINLQTFNATTTDPIKHDAFRILLPLTYNPVNNDNNPLTPAIPTLLPNTYYRVVVTNGVKNFVGQAMDRLNFDFDQTDAISRDSFSWIFKTKPENDLCGLDRVGVIPEELTLPAGGIKYLYFAQPWSEPDQCSSLGQRLNPYYYNWVWDDVAVTANPLPPPAFVNGADFINPAGYDGCGNGVVEPGEDCDPGLISIPNCNPITCQFSPIGGPSPTPLNSALASCGNRIIEPNEECDQGNEPNGDESDGCTDICTFSGAVPATNSVCGNSRIEKGEKCDDGELNSILAYYTLNGNANDILRRNNGTIFGAVTFEAGQRGRAAKFTGAVNQYIEVANNDSIKPIGAFTVSAWIKSTKTADPEGGNGLVASTYNCGWDGTTCAAQTGWSFGDDFGCGPTPCTPGDHFYLQVWGSSKNSAAASLDNFSSIYKDQWIYVTGVYQPGQYVRLYINGQLKAEDITNVPTAVAYNSGIPLRIGHRADNLTQGYFGGDLDDFRIYNRALTLSEIQTAMNDQCTNFDDPDTLCPSSTAQECQQNLRQCYWTGNDCITRACLDQNSSITGNNNYNQPTCGNGEIETGEECDDGNIKDGYCSVNNAPCDVIGSVCGGNGVCISDGCGPTCQNNGSAAKDNRIDPYQIVQTVDQLNVGLAQVNEEIRAWHNLQPDRVGVGLLTVTGGNIPFYVIGHQPPAGEANQCRNVSLWAVFSKPLKTDADNIKNNFIVKQCLNEDCSSASDNLVKNFYYQTIQGQCINNQCRYPLSDSDLGSFNSTCLIDAECVGSRVMATELTSGFLAANVTYQFDVTGVQSADNKNLTLNDCLNLSSPLCTKWQFQTNNDFCQCDYVGVTTWYSSGGAETTQDFFSCAGNNCGDQTPDIRDDDFANDNPTQEGTVPGNQHLYEAQCYDINNPQNSRLPIGFGATYQWSEIDPTDAPKGIIYLTNKLCLYGEADKILNVCSVNSDCGTNGLCSVYEPITYVTPGEETRNSSGAITSQTPKGKSGQAEVRVVAQEYHNAAGQFCLDDLTNPNDGCLPRLASSQNVAVTNFICDNPWPALGPYVDSITNCRDDLNSCLNTNFDLLYCRDDGQAGLTGDLPALSESPVVLGTRSKTIKEFLFPFGENIETAVASRDALGIQVRPNPLRLSPLTWYRSGLCGGAPNFESLCFSDADCNGLNNPDLIAYYSFDDQNNLGNDLAGDNDGTNNGAVFNPVGKISGAVQFDGLPNKSIEVNTTEVKPTSAFSISAWVKNNNNPTVQAGYGVVASTYNCGWDGTTCAAQTGWSFGDNFGCGPTPCTPDDHFYLQVWGSSNNSATASKSGFFAAYSGWTHVAGVFKPGESVQLYVNGEKVAETKTSILQVAYPNLPLHIGNRPDNQAQGVWNGSVDDLRIYARALTESEIRLLAEGRDNQCQFNVPTKGSPQTMTVDGYQAIRDGRTVYVGAPNLGTSDLFSNIYLISYSQNASAQTQEVFNRILDPAKTLGLWRFNIDFTNHQICSVGNFSGTDTICGAPNSSTYIGLANTAQCAALSDQSSCQSESENLGCYWASSVNGCLAKVCEPIYCNNNFECPNLSCSAEKQQVVRDAKRFSDLRDTQVLLENYAQRKNGYPLLTGGSYIASTTFSIWPSWQQTLSKELSTNLPTDPLNLFKGCNNNNYFCDDNNDGLIDHNIEKTFCDLGNINSCNKRPALCLPFDPDQDRTCWDEVSKFFSCPAEMFVYGYRSAESGKSYELYTNLEYDTSLPNWVSGSYQLPLSNISGSVCQKLDLEVHQQRTNGATAEANCLNDGGDADSDGICDRNDNCNPSVSCPGNARNCYNPDQRNSNSPADSIGDVCDSTCSGDADSDGVCDELDNCRTVRNPANHCAITTEDPNGQCDADKDGVGDACDPCTDVDEDGWWDEDTGANDERVCRRDNVSPWSNGFCQDTEGKRNGQHCHDVSDCSSPYRASCFVPFNGFGVSNDRRSYCANNGIPTPKVCQSVDNCLPNQTCEKFTDNNFRYYNPFQEDYDNDQIGYIADDCLDFDNDSFGDYSFYTKSNNPLDLETFQAYCTDAFGDPILDQQCIQPTDQETICLYGLGPEYDYNDDRRWNFEDASWGPLGKPCPPGKICDLNNDGFFNAVDTQMYNNILQDSNLGDCDQVIDYTDTSLCYVCADTNNTGISTFDDYIVVSSLAGHEDHFQGCQGDKNQFGDFNAAAGEIDLDNCPAGPNGAVCKDQFGIQISCANLDQLDTDGDNIGNICDSANNPQSRGENGVVAGAAFTEKARENILWYNKMSQWLASLF